MSEIKHCAMDTRDLVVLLADLAEQNETVIGKKGIHAYKNETLTRRTKSYKKGTHLRVKKIVEAAGIQVMYDPKAIHPQNSPFHSYSNDLEGRVQNLISALEKYDILLSFHLQKKFLLMLSKL